MGAAAAAAAPVPSTTVVKLAIDLAGVQPGPYLDALLAQLGPLAQLQPLLEGAAGAPAVLAACGAVHNVAAETRRRDSLREAGLLSALVRAARREAARGTAEGADEALTACCSAMAAAAAANVRSAVYLQSEGVEELARRAAAAPAASCALGDAAMAVIRAMVRVYGVARLTGVLLGQPAVLCAIRAA